MSKVKVGKIYLLDHQRVSNAIDFQYKFAFNYVIKLS